MPSYIDELCPVCGRPFCDGDDIVTCPVCGTPHHRECYNKIGHCRNDALHESGFEFKRQNQKQDDSATNAEKKVPVGSVFVPEEVLRDNNGSANANQTNQQNKGYTPPQSPFSRARFSFVDESEKIDGVSAVEVACTVRTNSERYLKKFKTGKKISWNWGAFFFGPYYFFFRKMYKEGSLFLAISLIISLVVQGIFAEPYAKLTEFITANANDIAYSTLSSGLTTQLNSLVQNVLPMIAIEFAALLVLHIIIGAISDNLYKKKVFKIIKDVDEKLSDNNVMSQITMQFPTEEIPVGQESFKEFYLAKTGGTSYFAPVVAFFILDIITQLISRL